MKKLLPLLICSFMLFAFTAHAQYTNMLNFNNTNGWAPPGSLITDGTYLYGMTTQGGKSNYGVIFKIKPNGTGDTVLLNFNNTNGDGPQGSLIYDGTYLYGMTTHGGPISEGVLFRIKPDGTGDTVLLNFGGTNGSYPHGSLYYDGTYLYGMTTYGGAGSAGVLFRIKPNGTGDTTLLTFSSTIGEYPYYCTLISDGKFLYGMAPSGGKNSDGVIFKIKPNGTGDSVLFNFNGANGKSPQGSLIYDGTYLYGMTQLGGTNGLGNIFKVLPNGNGYVDLFDFSGANGEEPYGTLLSDGNYLYGMTQAGGPKSDGNIFRIKPNGKAFSDLFDFTGTANGMNPTGDLINVGGALYGMANGGGTNGMGVIFQMDTAVTGINEISAGSGEVKLFPNPNNGEFQLVITNYDLGIKNIEVYNMLGDKIYSSKFNASTTQINLSNNSAGIYLYRINTETGNLISQGKFIIQK